MAGKTKSRHPGIFSRRRKKFKMNNRPKMTRFEPRPLTLTSQSPTKIPSDFVDSAILQIENLKICANCKDVLTDDNNFPFGSSMSYINTCTISQALSIVYPENWKHLENCSKSQIDKQYLCIKCIARLNKIYKSYIKFEGILSFINKSFPETGEENGF